MMHSTDAPGYSDSIFEIEATNVLGDLAKNDELLEKLETRWSIMTPNNKDASYILMGRKGKLNRKDVLNEPQ